MKRRVKQALLGASSLRRLPFLREHLLYFVLNLKKLRQPKQAKAPEIRANSFDRHIRRLKYLLNGKLRYHLHL